jgi:tetratricopeptide (TPR) repeat protein
VRVKPHLLQRCLLLLAIAGLGTGAPRAQTENEDFDRGSALRTKADYFGAATVFENWLIAYPQSPRVPEALVQAGIARMEAGRTRQMLHRNPPDALEQFTRALGHLGKVLSDHPRHASAARAQYVSGSVQLFLGDLEASNDAYEQVLARYATDTRYAPKALLRRAELRHHLLQPQLALADYQQWKKEQQRPSSDEEASKVDFALSYLSRLGKPAPPLEIVPVRGEPRPLEALRGKVVALLFFDIECHSCPKELPFLEELRKRYGVRGLELLSVANKKRGATAAQVGAYLIEHPVSWPVVLDAGATFDAYDAEMSPNLVLVDKRGVARWHEHPAVLADATIERLLAESIAPAQK